MTKQDYIQVLQLEKHVEGGWFKEVYASSVIYDNRPTMTSIYFLLDETNFSAYHKLTADETWYFHDGNPLHISMIDLDGNLHDVVLGKNIKQGEVLSYVVPKGWVFGSYVDKGFSLVSCAVSPGFTYEDFKLFTYEELINKFSKHKTMIKKLTRK